MKKLIIVILLLCVAAFVFYFFKGSDVSRSLAMRKSLQNADQIFVYEGLPHQFFEEEALEKEMKGKDVKKIVDYPFYSPKVQASVEMANLLKPLLASAESFCKFSGEKECGGFHPDYAVVWTSGKKEFSVLICFGCGEVIFTGGSEQLRYDMDGEAEEELKKLLADFANKRPRSTEILSE